MSKKTKPKRKLFEVTIQSYKSFYVEAESEDAVLESGAVDDEAHSRFGKFDWEHNETRASEIDEQQAVRIRERYPKQIIQSDDE